MCFVRSFPNHVLGVRVVYVDRSAVLPGSPIFSFFSFLCFFFLCFSFFTSSPLEIFHILCRRHSNSFPFLVDLKKRCTKQNI
jgi:hypothetical protein